MANWKKLAQGAAGAAGGGGLNVEQVFSTYLFQGNQTARTITNGIDLAGEGGLTWITPRTTGTEGNFIDSERGVGATTPVLVTSQSNGEINRSGAVTAYNSDGFDLGTYDATNYSGRDMVSWTFRKAAGFFDVVTYSGSSSAQTIAHNLGVVPAVMIVKQRNSSGRWTVYHKDASPTGNPENGRLALNTADAWAEYPTVSSFQNLWNLTAPTSTHFTVGTDATTGASGSTYVAYLFASNEGTGTFGPTGDQDIIKCGNYTGTGQAGLEIDLGFEPQWVLIKHADGGQYWNIFDTMRGIGDGTNDPRIWPNYVGAENQTLNALKVTPTGFIIEDTGAQTNNNNTNYIFIAVRRGPMATPEDAADVFDMHTGSAYQTRFDIDISEVDLAITKEQGSGSDTYTGSRIQNGNWLRLNSTDPQGTSEHGLFDSSDQYAQKQGGTNMMTWMWKRAPSFFDCLTYAGDGATTRSIEHNLGVEPEMIWIKSITQTQDWYVYAAPIYGDDGYDILRFNSSNAADRTNSVTFPSAPTASVFNIYKFSNILNDSGERYIAFLFASLSGVSKVGSYTGNGSNGKVIDCGFSNGARFVLIKCTSSAGNWWVFDTERGINAGNDPMFKFDTNGAELTSYDEIDYHSSGFIVNYSAGEVNINGEDYIFYAVA